MPENFEDQFDDLSADLLTIEDEEGNLHEFEIVDQVDIDDERYVALIAADMDEDEDDDEQGELVILRSEIIDEEEFLSAIEDEEEFDRISAVFLERLADDFLFEE